MRYVKISTWVCVILLLFKFSVPKQVPGNPKTNQGYISNSGPHITSLSQGQSTGPLPFDPKQDDRSL